jgi:hypothetical protein
MSSLLGESYDYWKSIKQPAAMGMSPGFSLDALATNVDGLLSYVEVLISGTGNASVTGKPLGNKFFLGTTGQCSETTAEKWRKEREEDAAWEREYREVDVKEGAKQITEDQATKLKNALNEQKKQRDEKRAGDKKKVKRWIYVNNIPDGTIPFIANGADGQTFDDLRGLIPGALGNLGALNPVQLFNGFTAGTYPDCAEVTLQTVNNDNSRHRETRHIALVEMVEMNPCHFPDGRNPASGKTCPKNERIEGLSDMGTLAGSSGVAYQLSHRSPLSYNISAMKSSPAASGLSYDQFQRGGDNGNSSSSNKPAGEVQLNAKEILDRHNNNVSSFYNIPMLSENEAAAAQNDSTSAGSFTLYDEMIEKLSEIIHPRSEEETHDAGNASTDLSNIEGDAMAQIYYGSLTVIMLYLLYKMLYSKKR